MRPYSPYSLIWLYTQTLFLVLRSASFCVCSNCWVMCPCSPYSLIWLYAQPLFLVLRSASRSDTFGSTTFAGTSVANGVTYEIRLHCLFNIFISVNHSMEVFAASIPCPSDCRGSWGINQTWDLLSTTCHSTCSRAFLLLFWYFVRLIEALCRNSLLMLSRPCALSILCFYLFIWQVVSCQSAKNFFELNSNCNCTKLLRVKRGHVCPKVLDLFVYCRWENIFYHYVKPGRGARPRPATKISR